MNKSLLFAPVVVFGLMASPVKADVVMFGDTDPGPLCSPTASGNPGDKGHVCAVNESFGQVVAHGFSGAPVPGNGNVRLTDKGGPGAPGDLQPTDAFFESGLGITSSSTACTGPCEIVPPESVVVSAVGSNEITTAIVGSLQPGETFAFFVEKADGGPFSRIAGGPFGYGNNCAGSPAMAVGPVADACKWTNAAGVFAIAVQSITGSETIVDVSTRGVPEPGTGGVPEPGSFALLGMGLLALGYLSRRRWSIA